MIKTRNKNEEKLIKIFYKEKQEHLLYFWNDLNEKEKDSLIEELSKVPFDEIKLYFKKFKNHETKIINLSETECFSINKSINKIQIKKIGIEAIKSNKIAILTVAGGQGSRLGYDHPKGFYQISPVTKKSLFQIFSEKIKFYSSYYNVDLNWLIMTSVSNYNEIKDYFKKNNFFGLKENNVYFFEQGTIPSLTLDGKLILENKNKIFSNPDGHGGVISALIKNQLLYKLKKKGITSIMYFQVDNPLVKIIDPYFIGYHIQTKSLVTSKVIKKLYPEEKLGIIGKINNKNHVIEYSDLSKEDMYAKKPDDSLKYDMGSIAIHIFNVDFLSNFSKKMPIHYAAKKIKGFDFKSEKPEIKEIDGVKFEKFVFDSIPLANNSKFYETDREEEFYPLKNKTGIDSIESCITGQSKLFYFWLVNCGLIKDAFTNQKIEISPFYAPDNEIFLEKASKDSDKIKKLIFNENGILKNEIYIE